VEIAKALSTKARALILDEPTSALSQTEADRLFDLVKDLAEQGVGIIYVSHRLEEIEGLVDRVTVLRDGRSMGTFPASELDRARIVSLITGHDEPPAKLSSQSSRTPGDTVLELRDLTFPGSFEGVSLRVRAGEIVVMTGLLGAGRTEVLETVFGARVPTRGDIRLNGEPVRFSNPSDAIARGVALLPEDRRGQGIIEGLPIFKNLTLASLTDFIGRFGLDIGREISRANQVIKDLSIRTPGPTTLVRSLSGGNQQKVVVGKWLLTSAKLILFDEPTQGLDVGAKDEIYGLLNSLVEEGKALLVVSSDMEEVLEIADRVIVMREGRVVGEFSGEAIQAEEMMSAITLGEAA
jgi:ribose transport system ATP-binding protein